ncbi:fatty acid desaturase [Cyanobium sp. FGCU-6]|nr:fatty acid desaturase [Cyanobium sp. FGCU6]
MSNTALLRDLCGAVADLTVPPSPAERACTGLRLTLLLVVLLSGAWVYWRLPLGWAAIAALLVAAVAYALLLIATHEMVHGTCLGLARWEQPLACLLSWPMAWPYLTYGRLHRLHHRWNGCDGRDPERTTALLEELQQAGVLRRLWQRQQLPLRLLLLGGVGLIVDTAGKGWRLRAVDRSLAGARWRDGAGVTLVHATMLLIALRHGELGRYMLFWLLLERVIGLFVQFRGLVEHHGLWPPGLSPPHASHLLTQLYSTRNVQAAAWLNALMGGLPHHSAHHAFPWIPSARLPLASRRIAAVLQRHGADVVPQVAGYGDGLGWLWREGHRCRIQDSPTCSSRVA